MGVGGPAHYFSKVRTKEEMQEQISFALKEKLPFFVLGKGSNSLFDDRGFAGLVILNQIDFCERQGNRFRVGSGFSFPRLGKLTTKLGFTGLEFAAGIPATVGGAVFMNAGAGKQEVKDTLKSVLFVDTQSHLIEEFDFSYRNSCFQTMQGAIVEATFELEASLRAKEEEKKKMQYRLRTQPYKMKSCGCIFRNLKHEAAGRLIETCGLKGMRVGGVSVSQLHGNFIVNDQNGTASDVRLLIQKIQEKIYQETGFLLEEEIRFIPYES